MIRNKVRVITKLDEYSEFRKGSTKYGELINSITFWLRNHITENDGLKGLSVEVSKFIEETNIDLEFLKELINEQDSFNLVSFKMDIRDDILYFEDFFENKKKMVWEIKKEE